MARILISGATGFIGRRLTEKLKQHHEIFALTKIPREPVPGIEWVVHDLSQLLDARRLPKSVDAVIHLAQSKHYKEFPEHAEDIFGINVRGAFELLEYGRKAGIGRFIFASTGGVYGYSVEKFLETDPVNPLNFYLASKYSTELLMSSYRPFFTPIVFRFFFVYGPGQTARLIPDFIDKIKRGQPLAIDGNPGIRINPIYIDDLIRVFEPALSLREPELINIAGDEAVTMTELVRTMERVIGKKAILQYRDRASQGDLIGDNTRMKKLLNITPAVRLEEGLRRTAAGG